jgi:hypothetical protein
VAGIDPAQASLEAARAKGKAAAVTWDLRRRREGASGRR